MGWGRNSSYRRAAAAIALLGVTVYALLLPWHLTSQFARALFAADYGISAQAMCRAEASGTSIPGAPDAGCPICKGVAAFHFALMPAAQAELAAPPSLAIPLAYAREDLAGERIETPRNRGPPLPA